MPKRILLLTFFFPPDLSAGSFRAQALFDAIRLQTGDDVHIDVITTQPNRYDSYSAAASKIELDGRVRILRVKLPSHKSGFIDQSQAFFWFAIQAFRLTRTEKYDLVIATSSRLMTATLGTFIARKGRAKLYLDIRDIFVRNIQEMFPPLISKPLNWVFSRFERWSIGSALKVNLVSKGFLDYFTRRYPNRTFSLYTNGVDNDFLNFPSSTKTHLAPDEPLRILYAGNIGDGQGLHLIIPELAKQLEHKATIQIIGAGSRLELLKETLKNQDIRNVELTDPIPRKDLLSIYQSADILFMHLNTHRAFRRVLPSKLFEYAATGKPIWAGATGYAANFLANEVSNSVVFDPCDADGAIEVLKNLRLEQVSRPEFVERYSRNRIMRPMAREIIDILELSQ
ncbi:glycosyltransferase family 4 protein [Pseudomonas putida]